MGCIQTKVRNLILNPPLYHWLRLSLNFFISNSSRPLDERTLYVEGGLTIKLSHANENLISSIGWPDNLLKVVNLRSKAVVLCGKVKLIGGMSWHYKLPYVCAGSDRELCFWRININ